MVASARVLSTARVDIGATITGAANYYGAVAGDMDNGLVEDLRVENSSVTATGLDQSAVGGAIGGAGTSTIRRVVVEIGRAHV